MRFLTFLLLLVLTACASLVPARTPTQLEATAGLAIIINDEMVDAGDFTVDYPDGWRVVKLSLAGDPITLTFVAPDDNETRITVSQTTIVTEGTPDPAIYERFETVESGSNRLYLAGQSPIESREAFDRIFEAVVDSIRFP